MGREMTDVERGKMRREGWTAEEGGGGGAGGWGGAK